MLNPSSRLPSRNSSAEGAGVGERLVIDSVESVTLVVSKEENGSDGTRTRDLRRDRPLRVQRRPTSSHLHLGHLQGLSRLGSGPFRMVAWVLSRAFGPRVGHGTQLYFVDLHEAS